MSIDTEIQNMIQNTIDEQDFVCRLDAEQYTDDQIAGLEDQARTCKIFRAALERHQGLAADLQTLKDLDLEP